MTKAFVRELDGLGDRLAAPNGDQQNAIVRHFVEVIELHPSDLTGNQGTYLMRLFSDAQPGATAPKNDNGGSVLTEPPLVRQVDDSAPPVGLEPTTKRLTAACSTN